MFLVGRTGVLADDLARQWPRIFGAGDDAAGAMDYMFPDDMGDDAGRGQAAEQAVPDRWSRVLARRHLRRPDITIDSRLARGRARRLALALR